jgi:transcription elongation factor Elf1
MTQQTKPVRKWVTSPHGRPRCPVHQVRLVAVSAHGAIGIVRCQICGYKRKIAREPIRD